MKYGIALKAGKGKKSAKVAKAIVSIIEAAPDRETAVAGLTAFREATSIQNTSISGCTIAGRLVRHEDDV